MAEEKIRWRNFPLFLLEPLMKVATCGEKKHGTFTFLSNEYTVNDHMDALKRHLEAFENPFEDDRNMDDGGHLHIVHVAWRALIIAFIMTYRKHLDDRIKRKDIEDAMAEEQVATKMSNPPQV